MTGETTGPERLAHAVVVGYHDFVRRFRDVTQHARRRFETRAWTEGQEDARQRILLYDVVIHETLAEVRKQLAPDGLPDDPARSRAAFAEWARGRDDAEVAETFYNSVVRRLFGTIGVDPAIEFVGDDVDDPSPGPAPWREISLAHGFQAMLNHVLDSVPLDAPWDDRDRDAARAARRLHRDLGPDDEWAGATLQLLRPLFYRNKAAYLVGRLVRGHETVPLALALLHPDRGVILDAVLTTSDQASVVFGFTRSYLHADVGAPRPTIDFLRSIMPLKRVDELYTAIGFNRHGKTEFYRTLRQHLSEPEARFQFTPGKEGLVMIVFTLPGLNVVFKVIRDQFGHPKKTTPQRVKRNYGMIFVRDRVGRLADAQEFERLELPRERFDPPVLRELLDNASRTATLEDDTVIIEHLYVERRVRPLDLYLDDVEPEQARRATLQFGQAIKDLAAADIFPGDMLIKNFGVTRHGRVIFYDYDEVAPLTRCNFRSMPQAAYPEAEFDESPHFYVGPDDVFPEEWRAFLGPAGPLRHTLQEAYPELFDPAWWRSMQERQRAGEVVDFFPYEEEQRLL